MSEGKLEIFYFLSISKPLFHVDTSYVKKGYDTTFLLIVLRMKHPKDVLCHAPFHWVLKTFKDYLIIFL